MQLSLIRIICRISGILLFLVLFPISPNYSYLSVSTFPLFSFSKSLSHNYCLAFLQPFSFLLLCLPASLYNVLSVLHHQSQDCLTAFLIMLWHSKSIWCVWLLYINHTSAVCSTAPNIPGSTVVLFYFFFFKKLCHIKRQNNIINHRKQICLPLQLHDKNISAHIFYLYLSSKERIHHMRSPKVYFLLF